MILVPLSLAVITGCRGTADDAVRWAGDSEPVSAVVRAYLDDLSRHIGTLGDEARTLRGRVDQLVEAAGVEGRLADAVDGLVFSLGCDLALQSPDGLTVEGVMASLRIRAAILGVSLVDDGWVREVGEELISAAASPIARQEAIEFCSAVAELARQLG